MAYPGQRARKRRLIPDWRRSWRFLSVQVNAGFAAVFASIIAAAPGLVVDVLRAGLLERCVVGAMILVAFIGTHWAARVVKQGGGHGD